MRIMRTAVRAGRKASHHQPHTKPSAPVRKAPTAPAAPDQYRQRDLANLRDMERWAGAGFQVKPRPEKVEATEEAAPAPAMTADRPQSITDMVGQDELRNQLAIVVTGTRARGKLPPHFLVSGPAGFGKTTVAAIVAHELGWHFVESNGMALRKPQDVVGLLMKLEPQTVLFVDEIHALPKPVMETLYEVLEDGKLSTTMGSGTEATAYTHRMQGFVCVGATTRPGVLTVPFRDRFGAQFTMAEYSDEDLATIVARAWEREGVSFADDEPMAVAARCKGVPRRGLHLADRVLDYAAVHGLDKVPDGLVAEALEAFHIDEMGLDDTDFRIIEALCTTFAGRTVGLDALAQFLNLDQKTLQDEHEPYLSRVGLVVRAKTGRMATPDAYALVREGE